MLAVSCKYEPDKYVKEKLIVCTTTMISDGIQEIVGAKYEVKTLMGAGVDPHLYEPRPSDVRALGEAKVIVYNGLHLEGKMSDLFEKLKNEKRVIAMSDGMPKNKLIALNVHSYDPHVWFDTYLWLDGLENAVQQLTKTYPEDEAIFMSRFLELKKRYLAMAAELKNNLSQIPATKRVLITSHDAFHYFGRLNEVEVMGLQGVSTASEPGIKDISVLVNTIMSRNIKAVFVESSVSPKAIKSVIESCKSKGYVLKIGNTLYSDALGSKASGAGTYEGMQKANVASIIAGLK